jgi:hypothetical protein
VYISVFFYLTALVIRCMVQRSHVPRSAVACPVDVRCRLLRTPSPIQDGSSSVSTGRPKDRMWMHQQRD